MKNKVSIPLSLLLVIAGTYAGSAQAQTRSTIRLPKVTTQSTPAPRNPAPANSAGTSSPAAPNGCFVTKGDGLPTQYVCPGSAAGTSTSGNANNGAASGSAGSQSLCAPWLSGRIKVSAQLAQELSRSCFGQGVNSSTQPPTGSPNGNVPQGYANSFAPGTPPAYLPQTSAAPDSSANANTQAVDPETFKTSGSGAVAANMDALIDGTATNAPSPPAPDPGLSDQQENALDTFLNEQEALTEAVPKAIDNFKNSGVWNAVGNFLSTEVEPDLSGAVSDIGGVFIDLGKGLLDPGTALGVKAIVDQANDPNKFLNASERSQMCAIMPDTCPPSQANQPTQATPQPKQP